MSLIKMFTEEEIKEDFCPVCIVGPLAFAGASATAMGGTMSKKHKKWRQMLLISGISTIVLSLLVLGYFLIFKRECKECRL